MVPVRLFALTLISICTSAGDRCRQPCLSTCDTVLMVVVGSRVHAMHFIVTISAAQPEQPRLPVHADGADYTATLQAAASSFAPSSGHVISGVQLPAKAHGGCRTGCQ